MTSVTRRGIPEGVLSLTSIMSTVGGPNAVQAKPAIGAVLLAPPGRTREEQVERSLANRRLIFGTGMPSDEHRARRKAPGWRVRVRVERITLVGRPLMSVITAAQLCLICERAHLRALRPSREKSCQTGTHTSPDEERGRGQRWRRASARSWR
jgi:hypothetical protein